jgi:microcystin-dependent protein
MALSVTSPIWQQVNTPALDMRRYISSLISSEGIVASGDLTVSQRSAGANMSVDVSSGRAMIQGDLITQQGYYFAYNDSVQNVTGFSAANATNPRIDRVCLRVRDAFHGDAANDVAFVIITGTATSGATLANLTGAGAVPASHLLLANVLVPASATTITTANIANVASTLQVTASAPSGSLLQYAGSTAPLGYLLADGTSYATTLYPGLFAAIGYAYGGAGANFNVPDLRGRVAVGMGTHTDVDALGENDGSALADRRPRHKHTVSPSTVVPSTSANTAGGTGNWPAAEVALTVGPQTNSPTDAPAYLVVNYIIKT